MTTRNKLGTLLALVLITALMVVVGLMLVTGRAAGATVNRNLATLQSFTDPPECVNVQLVQGDGSGTFVYALFCGEGPDTESPLHDYLKGRALLLDGAVASFTGCGTKLGTSPGPCVFFDPQAPPS